MVVELTWQTIITAGAVVGALSAIIAMLFRVVRWVDRQKKQDAEISALRKQHDNDIRALQHEQTLCIYALLAALKGLQELGCNGPVTEAVRKVEKYLNQKAHGEALHEN